MFARLTIFDDIDRGLEEEALEWAHTEGLRISRELPGYVGAMTLVDRDGRRLVGIGLYDSEDNARQADELLRQGLPESFPDVLKQALNSQTYVGLLDVVERDGI